MNEKLEVPTMQVPPLKKICMTIGELPTSYLNSMTYYEMLLWFVNYLRDDIIPVVNANGLATQELQELFVELQSYVNTYFDNLDVQEEVDNKIQDMADSGQLTDIIAQYLGLAGMITFNTVAEMKLAENLVNGSKCATLGYYSANDGGKAFYKVRNVTNEDVVDEKTIIALYDNSLVAELIIENEINIKVLGAIANQDIDTILNTYMELFKKINIIGNYTISQNVIATSPIELNFYGTITNSSTTPYYISLLNDSKIKGLNSSNVGIDVYGNNNIIENCSVSNSTASSYYINCGNSTTHINNKFINCKSTLSSGFGFQIARNTNITERSESIADAIIDNIIFENCKSSYAGETQSEVVGTWATGFCIENAGAINKTITYINCESSYSAESGFHCEYNTIPTNLTYINCYSHDNGLLKNPATYGAGYVIPQQATAINCISHNNYKMYQCSNIDIYAPINKFENLDIKDIDSTNHYIKSLRSLFSENYCYNRAWNGKNIVFTTTTLTSTTNTPKLRPEFYYNKLTEDRLNGYITVTNNEISFGTVATTKWTVGLNIVEVDPTLKINFKLDAKAKVETVGTNNNFCVFLVGFDEHFVNKGTVTSQFLNGINTSDYTTISKTNVTISNQDIKYVVMVLMPQYSTSYTYQAPDIKNITIYQNE